MTIKRIVFLLAAGAFFGAALSQCAQAADDGTLPREATVPTTQSTVDMDAEEESGEGSSGLVGPTLDISREADRQRLLAGFAQEKEILKKRGLSEEDLNELKDAIIAGDAGKADEIYKKARETTGGDDE